jgi:uncharacterized protein
VTITEFLTLLEALKAGFGDLSAERFYLSGAHLPGQGRAHYDRFDRRSPRISRAPRTCSRAVARAAGRLAREAGSSRGSPTPKRREIEALGGWEKLMETLKQRLEEQQGGTRAAASGSAPAGTSPFGAYGYNPEGVRIGQDRARNRSAVKVWDRREFANLDDTSSSARAT